MRKRHGQYCPIARTLDLVGDRWSLLILRELLFGDQRFVDLREHLPGSRRRSSASVCKRSPSTALVATKELPPPAARTVYTATAKARDAVPILQAMARFGMELLPRAAPVDRRCAPRPPRTAPSPHGTTRRAATGIDEVYRLVVDGTRLHARERRAARPAPPCVAAGPRARRPAHVLLAARRGETTLADAVATGRPPRPAASARSRTSSALSRLEVRRRPRSIRRASSALELARAGRLGGLQTHEGLAQSDPDVDASRRRGRPPRGSRRRPRVGRRSRAARRASLQQPDSDLADAGAAPALYPCIPSARRAGLQLPERTRQGDGVDDAVSVVQREGRTLVVRRVDEEDVGVEGKSARTRRWSSLKVTLILVSGSTGWWPPPRRACPSGRRAGSRAARRS